jgi:hypothetical protein
LPGDTREQKSKKIPIEDGNTFKIGDFLFTLHLEDDNTPLKGFVEITLTQLRPYLANELIIGWSDPKRHPLTHDILTGELDPNVSHFRFEMKDFGKLDETIPKISALSKAIEQLAESKPICLLRVGAQNDAGGMIDFDRLKQGFRDNEVDAHVVSMSPQGDVGL